MELNLKLKSEDSEITASNIIVHSNATYDDYYNNYYSKEEKNNRTKRSFYNFITVLIISTVIIGIITAFIISGIGVNIYGILIAIAIDLVLSFFSFILSNDDDSYLIRDKIILDRNVIPDSVELIKHFNELSNSYNFEVLYAYTEEDNVVCYDKISDFNHEEKLGLSDIHIDLDRRLITFPYNFMGLESK